MKGLDRSTDEIRVATYDIKNDSESGKEVVDVSEIWVHVKHPS